jgi:two-component system, chemotaxis family, protein-glutamate methylesterase/glutaminase
MSTAHPFPRTAFDVVALAASAGGLAAFCQILAALPVDFPAAVVLLRHVAPDYQSHLAEILSKWTDLPVTEAQDGDCLHPSTVVIAPPNRHLIISSVSTLRLLDAPRVNFVRPSADVLFRSIAQNIQQRAIAVVLTGGDSDGADGAKEIKQAGGAVIAQDEATSEVFSMPRAAIATGCVDFVLPLSEIAATLMQLAAGGRPLKHADRPQIRQRGLDADRG